MSVEAREFAVTITAPEQAELLPVDRAAGPTTGRQVSGRTLATLVSAGTELASAYRGTNFPTVPGYAAAFEVEEVGEAVRGFRPGDRAFCMGPHRSFQSVPEDQAIRLPPGLSAEAAVFARLMGVTMSTLTTTTARPPQQVLVTGLGLVGHLAARVFALCGYEVIGCDPVESRRDLLRSAGIKRVFPTPPVDDPALAGRVALAIDCSGHEGAVLNACHMVRKRGEVVLTGTPWQQKTDLSAHDLLHLVFHRYIVLRSGWEWELPIQPAEFRTNSVMENLAGALLWLGEGRLNVDGLYTAVHPREAGSVYQQLLQGQWPSLGAIFDWTSSA